MKSKYKTASFDDVHMCPVCHEPLTIHDKLYFFTIDGRRVGEPVHDCCAELMPDKAETLDELLENLLLIVGLDYEVGDLTDVEEW